MRPPTAELTPEDLAAVQDPLGTAGLSPEAFLFAISGPVGLLKLRNAHCWTNAVSLICLIVTT